MWTLILFSYILVSGVGDTAFSHHISGFSTKTTCEEAGKTIIQDNVKQDYSALSGIVNRKIQTHSEELNIKYYCVEVK